MLGREKNEKILVLCTVIHKKTPIKRKGLNESKSNPSRQRGQRFPVPMGPRLTAKRVLKPVIRPSIHRTEAHPKGRLPPQALLTLIRIREHFVIIHFKVVHFPGLRERLRSLLAGRSGRTEFIGKV